MHDRSGFFEHHGWLAPGVRLFRRIGFPAKAACVSAAFLLPLGFACWALWSTASSAIAFSAKERLGTEYARPALELMEAAQVRRRAASHGGPDLPAATAGVAAAYDRLAAVQQRLGGALGTGASFDALTRLHRPLIDAPVGRSPEATFEAHTALVAAVGVLLRDATDGSNLTLDPDLDTFYMMNASLMQTPELVDGLGVLRTHGTAALRTGTADVARRDALTVAYATASANAKGLRVSLSRADGARPGLVATLPAEAAAAATDALLKAAREHVLGGAPGLDADAFLKLADAAVAGQYRLARGVLDALDSALDERVATLRRTLALQLGLAVAGVAVAFYLFLAFYRVTRGGIATVSHHLEQVAAGDLTGQPTPWGRDEAAALMHVVARTIHSLRTTVVHVRDAAGEVETASGEIASAAQDLSERTERTAAGLQRTAAEVQSIAGSVRATAGDAGDAATIVDRNADAARRGAEVMREATATMEDIRAASQRIADIIGTIDGIAFQTNILALNAAVEAARAGDQGRGFAVVAGEVRALAKRTTDAAREVKSLIDGNGERVASGSRVIESAGRAMLDIVGNADRIHALIGRISGATAEQTQGVGTVERAVNELDATTHQNAALVEQSAATAATLHESAARLSREMASFRTA